MEKYWRHGAVALLFAFVACGEIEEAPEESEPLARLTIHLGEGPHPSVQAPHVGLIWVPIGGGDEIPPFLTESAPLTGSLDSVQLSVFRGPPRDATRTHNGVKIAFGMIVAFDDADGDGAFEFELEGIAPPDLLFGFNPQELLVYLEIPEGAELSKGLFVNPEAFEPGLSRARLDLCGDTLEFLPMAAPIVLETFDPRSEYGFDPGCEAEEP